VSKLKHHVDYNIKHGYNTYCSKECVNKNKFVGKEVKCANCGKLIWKSQSNLLRSKSKNYYCSKHCATVINNTLYKSGEANPNYTTGESSYRPRALKHYKNKCAKCSYNNVDVLEVHHIDHNRENNKLSNLVILCPTHHKELTIAEMKK
jgi:hypothetical protein